jgi:hypothetical protein
VRRSHVEFMSSLERANPLEDAMSWWTRPEEDALLATILAENPEASTPDVSSVPPGPPHRLTRVALIGLCALVAAGAALAAVLASSGSPSAFAAWTATTTTPPASQLAAAASSCQHRYGLTLRLLGKPQVATLPSSLPPLVLTDSRGPFEMLVFSGPTGQGVCLWDSSKVLTLTGSNGETLPAASDDSIGVPGVGFDRDGGSSVLTYADGHAGAHVTRVTLDLANGVRVEATVQNGFYAAWWPSQSDVTAAAVITTESPYHQDFGDIGPNNPTSSGIQP